jgi:Matrixin/PEP-CTERM motif
MANQNSLLRAVLRSTWLPVLQLTVVCLGLASNPAFGQNIWGTRWNVPGPKNAVLAPPLGGTYGHGEVNWSIVAAGVAVNGAADADHPGNTYAFDSMLPVAFYPAGTARQMFDDAMDEWATAITVGNSSLVDLGQVADGGGVIGGAGAASTVADIRAAVLPWSAAIMITGGTSQSPEIPWDGDGSGGALGSPNALAHGAYPDTQAANLNGTGFGSLGGDIHFRPYLNYMGDPFGVNWYDDENGAGVPAANLAPNPVGLYTVMLHEIGHALGLTHINAAADIMSGAPYNGSNPDLTTSAGSVAAARLLYSVPEPSSIILFGFSGLGFLQLARRRRRVFAIREDR